MCYNHTQKVIIILWVFYMYLLVIILCIYMVPSVMVKNKSINGRSVLYVWTEWFVKSMSASHSNTFIHELKRKNANFWSPQHENNWLSTYRKNVWRPKKWRLQVITLWRLKQNIFCGLDDLWKWVDSVRDSSTLKVSATNHRSWCKN